VDKATLLRVVAVGGVLVPDPSARLPGRGASVHRDLQCVALAERRRAFSRALRLDGPLDVTPVREHLTRRAEQEHDAPQEQHGTRAAPQDHDESRQTREQHSMSQPT